MLLLFLLPRALRRPATFGAARALLRLVEQLLPARWVNRGARDLLLEAAVAAEV